MENNKSKKKNKITPRFGVYVSLSAEEIEKITELREKTNLTLREIMLKGMEYFEREYKNDDKNDKKES